MEDNKQYSHTEIIEDNILFDEDMSGNLVTHEMNNQLIYEGEFQLDFLSNLEETQDIYISFNNNEFIILPLSDKLIDEFQIIYFFGEKNDSGPIFTNYPVLMAILQPNYSEHDELDVGQQITVYSLTEFNHVTIKTVTKTEITTITPEFEHAVKHVLNTATTDDIQHIIKNYGIIEGDEEGMVIDTEFRTNSYGESYYATTISAESILENYQMGKNIVIHITIENLNSLMKSSPASETQSAIQIYLTLIKVKITPDNDPEFIFVPGDIEMYGIDSEDGALEFYYNGSNENAQV